MANKTNCVICHKGGIVMLCDRCEQTFCNEHITKHRQKHPNQLKNIIEKYDFIKNEIYQISDQHSILQKIDQWEKESIIKIQSNAESARKEAREMVEMAKERLSLYCRNMIETLQRNHETGQLCEKDLERTLEHLKQIQTKILSPLSIHLTEDKTSSIHLINVYGTDFMNNAFETIKVHQMKKVLTSGATQERFSKTIGPALVRDEGLLVKHNGQTSMFAYVLGERLYSQGRETIRLKIEKAQNPFNIFFGCTSSSTFSNDIHIDSPHIVGWFGNNEVYHHGKCDKNVQMHRYESNKIQSYDIISVTFNCDEQIIEFYPERTNKIHELAVDIHKTPFPWQLIVILAHENDSVKILYNA